MPRVGTPVPVAVGVAVGSDVIVGVAVAVLDTVGVGVAVPGSQFRSERGKWTGLGVVGGAAIGVAASAACRAEARQRNKRRAVPAQTNRRGCGDMLMAVSVLVTGGKTF